MPLRPATNVVYAMVPTVRCPEDVVDFMEAFGEVAGYNVVRNVHGLVEVAYYDVRDAASAMKTLGDKCCWAAAPCGDRFVQLPGSMKLQCSLDDQVRQLFKSKAFPGWFEMEFYDIRDAAMCKEQRRQHIAAMEWIPGQKTQAHMTEAYQDKDAQQNEVA